MKVIAALLLAVSIGLIGCASLESKIVGKYKVKLGEMPKDFPGGEAAMKVAESMASGMSLELKSDKTFVLNVPMASINGTWALAETTLTLTPKVDGTNVTTGKNEPLALKVSSDGKTLTPTKNMGGPEMSFVKE